MITVGMTSNKEGLATWPGRFYSIRTKGASLSNDYFKGYAVQNPFLNPESLTDEELVRLFVEKEDDNAFNEIAYRYADKIYRLAFKITKNQNDAEEVVQEIYFALMKKLHTFRQESKFSTWLYKLSENESYMYLRKKVKRVEKEISLSNSAKHYESDPIQGNEFADLSQVPDQIKINKETLNLLQKAVAGLSDQCRNAFCLRYLEGHSNKEIARLLGLSVWVVRSRVQRARTIIRKRLSYYCHG